jgi:3-dehydroquinate dehydratase-2
LEVIHAGTLRPVRLFRRGPGIGCLGPDRPAGGAVCYIVRPGDIRRIGKRKRRMSRLVYVLNGPNLNLLGKRQPHIYGHETLADVERDCRALAAELGLELRFHQSNREYEIIDWIHEARETAGGIVINPAAFTHTSVAVLDALNTFDAPVIEIHISNVHKREEFRHRSFVSLRADGVIAGCGTQGYLLALRRVGRLIDEKAASSPVA